MTASRDRRPRSALARGVDAAGQVGTAAAEVVRVRRDPSKVAQRQVDRARRRVVAWSAGTLASGAWATVQVVDWVQNGLSAFIVVWLVFCLAGLVWMAPNLTRSIGDLRARRRALTALPPPQPSRPAVPGVVRPQMQRLGQLSDGLRSLVGLIGWIEDDAVLTLRSDLITAADTAEVRLRRAAVGLGGLLKARDAAPAESRDAAHAVVERTIAQIDLGVEEYARLVAAATETVAAGEVAPAGELTAHSDTLLALAHGMREISAG